MIQGNVSKIKYIVIEEASHLFPLLPTNILRYYMHNNNIIPTNSNSKYPEGYNRVYFL